MDPISNPAESNATAPNQNLEITPVVTQSKFKMVIIYVIQLIAFLVYLPVASFVYVMTIYDTHNLRGSDAVAGVLINGGLFLFAVGAVYLLGMMMKRDKIVFFLMLFVFFFISLLLPLVLPVVYDMFF